jgi:biotin transport system substrate-specific component
VSTLAEAMAPRARSGNRALYSVASVVAGSLLVAALAQVSITLPFTPVPVTGQTLGVLLVGASLGAVLGGASLLLYLAEGAVGLPFFAQGASGVDVLRVSSATGGYLWGFVVAAALVGWLSRRGWDRSIRSSLGAMLLGEIVIFGLGLPWLMAALDVPAEKALEFGLYPFVIGDTVKLLLAAGLLPTAWRLVRRPSSRPPDATADPAPETES